MKTTRVLLVDDEEDFIATLAQRLQMRGYEAEIAHDGERALSMVASDTYDVMILDLMLPGLNGIDVLQEVKRQIPGIPVIMMTGQGSTKEGLEGMRSGAFDYLMKPVNIDELMLKIDEAAHKEKKPT